MIAMAVMLLLQAAPPALQADVASKNDSASHCIQQTAEAARGNGAEGHAVADAAAQGCEAERVALRAAIVVLMARHGVDRNRAETMFDANFQRWLVELVETSDPDYQQPQIAPPPIFRR